MNFGSDWHGAGLVDQKTAASLLDLALERGVNLIDTADIYGRGAAETLLGKIIGKRRPKIFLATKVLGEMRPGDASSGGLSARHIEEGLHDSLRRLKTDYVDLYMPHDSDPNVPLEESLEAFHRLVKSGKVRVLGVSNMPGREVQEWLDLAEARRWRAPQFNQVQYSLACRFIEEDLIPMCEGGSMSVLAWSPLGGGFLTGKYSSGKRPLGRRREQALAFPPLAEDRLGGLIEVLKRVAVLEGVTPAQAALGWVMGRPGVASAVVGARSLLQLSETLASRPLSSKSSAFLEKASSLV